MKFMVKNKTRVILLLSILTLAIVQVSISATYAAAQPNEINEELDLGDSEILDTLPKTQSEDLIPSSAATASNRIDFGFTWGTSWNVPLNIDCFGYYVHTNTDLTVDTFLTLPIDIMVDYNSSYYQGESKDVEIQMSLPENQACFGFDFDVDFDIAWNIPGVKDGDAELDWSYNYEKNFTTPLGEYNLDFLAIKYGIPVSIYGVQIGTLYIIATPQIFSHIRAQLLSNPQFVEAVKVEWEKEGTKTIQLTAKPDATTPGTYTVTLGNFEYVVSLGIQWSIEFEFVKPFNLINDFLEKIGYPLRLVLGTWPKFEIGSLKSEDEVPLTDIQIYDRDEDGSSFDKAIMIDADDWLSTPHDITLPGIISEYKYYTFLVQKDWKYDFDINSVSGGKQVDAYIYDISQTEIVASATSGTYPDSLSFIANQDGAFYLLLDPQSSPPNCTVNVEFTAIQWPGMTKTDYYKNLTFPFEGESESISDVITHRWYQFTGTSGYEVRFWLNQFSDTDDIDLYLFDDINSNPRDWNASDGILKSIAFELDSNGTWWLLVNGTVGEGNGTYWLDYTYTSLLWGNNIDGAKEFLNFFENYSLGLEESTRGGMWLRYWCTEKNHYNFTFNGESDGMYDIIVYDTDKSSILWQETFAGASRVFSYSRLFSTNWIYIHILPYRGGFRYNVSVNSEAFNYTGQSAARAQLIEDNFPVEGDLSSNWPEAFYWHKICLTAGTKVVVKLEFDPVDEYDLYFCDATGTILTDTQLSTANPELIIYDIPTDGWYTIQVDKLPGGSTTMNYTLTVAITYSIAPGSLSGSVSKENINDYYNIYLNVGDRIKIVTSLTGYRSAYVDLVLYDTDFNPVASDLTGEELEITYTAPKSGYYYIRFYHDVLNVEATFTGRVGINEIEWPPINWLLLLSIMIPSVCVAAVVGATVVRKQKKGVWFWNEEGVKRRAKRVARKSWLKAYKMRKSVSAGVDNLKKKVSAKVEDIKESPLRKVKRGEFPVRPVEEIQFDESFDDSLKDEEKEFLKKAPLSEKAADKDLKKAWGNSWDDEIEFDDEE